MSSIVIASFGMSLKGSLSDFRDVLFRIGVHFNFPQKVAG